MGRPKWFGLEDIPCANFSSFTRSLIYDHLSFNCTVSPGQLQCYAKLRKKVLHNMAGFFKKTENPFHFGRELGAENLIDREEEVSAVMDTVLQGGKLFVIGPRRFGKTSILKTAADRLEASGAVILRFDVEAYPTLDLLCRAMVAEAAQKLTLGWKKTGQKIKTLFSSLKPEASYNLNEQTWNVSLGAAAQMEDAEQVVLLVDCLNGIEQLAAEAKKPVGVLLDEFQKVIELGGRAAEGQIRAAVQQHRQVGYVFAGSKTRLLTDMTSDAARPFYRLGSRLWVGLIPRKLMIAALTSRFEMSGFHAPLATVEAILNCAEEVPYNVQMLAHSCWNFLLRSEPQPFTPEIVEEQLETIVRQDDPFYTKLWIQLTANQQKALLAVIREKGTGLFGKRPVRESGMTVSTLQRALEAVVAKEIVREEQTLGAVRYRFEDPFFAAWIALVVRSGK